MQTFQDWLHRYFTGNTVNSLLWFTGFLAIGLLLHQLLARQLSQWVYRLLKREIAGVPFNDFFRLIKPPVDALILLLIVYTACHQLTIPAHWQLPPSDQFGLRMVIERLYFTLVMAMFTWLAIRGVKVVGLLFQKRAELTASKFDDQLVPFIRDLLILFVCILGFFATLNWVYAINVLALVTSLGIGGLALALAARETLENLFASIAIVLDRPFLVGDSVSVGGVSGDVEKIGFRSTRIRTDDGSLLTVPNRLMVNQILDNLTQREARRARFIIRLAYDTSPDTVQAILEEIRHIIQTHPSTSKRTSQVRLDGLGESAFEILIIFFVETPAIAAFREIKESINFRIIEVIHRHKAHFAFSTQTVYIREASTEHTQPAHSAKNQ